MLAGFAVCDPIGGEEHKPVEARPADEFVGGEVVTPGIVPLRGPVTATQAILATGGVRTSARLSNVILVRYRDGNQAEVSSLDVESVMKGTGQDVLLQPFDVIFVPRSRIAKVGLFVEQYINAVIPRTLALVFPYNLNTSIVSQPEIVAPQPQPQQ